ncbi:phosphate signaling complex protein PhoU [Synechococcus elongatus IITB4]|uniref:phosphate signaling complex protein PhoU n=1 Tax=Synechococcus elongatus TaxID=32046 RepID=UPI0030CB705D
MPTLLDPMFHSTFEGLPSTRTRFMKQVKDVQQDILRMGALVENSCWLARQALVERDLSAPDQIDQQDQVIDALYRKIEQDCLSLVALQSPVSRDLRILSAFMQIVRDLERIGDYAENLGEIAVRLFALTPHPIIEPVGLMLERSRSMLAMSLAAIANIDAELGRAIKDKDDAVDADFDALYDRLVHDSQAQFNLEATVLLVLVIRHIERMADHATNVGQRICFIQSGRMPN